MFNFILCDDQNVFLNKLKDCMEKSINSLDFKNSNIFAYRDPNEVLNYIQNYNFEKPNIYFLDVDFGKNINGFNIAKKIRENDAQAYIIFITNHLELSTYTFKYNLKAFDYISKISLNYNEIYKCLKNLKDDYVISQQQNKKYIVIKSGPKEIKLNINEIYYFESCGYKINIYTMNQKIEINNSLKNIISLLPDDNFYRCHNSFLINKNHISEIDYNKLIVTMKNGETCLLSRNKKEEIKNILKKESIVI